MAPPPSKKEKLDLRRIQGQASCAECRRLKLKCDKKIPCASCLRRGCDSVCPTGTLANGMGKKLVLSDTGDLHRKVDDMGARIKQLEEAIEKFQSTVSTETHPLLRPELLVVKFPPGLAILTQKPESPTLELADALGTLAINDQGNTRYFGSSAGTESLFLAGAELPSDVPGESGESVPDYLKPCPPVEKNFPLASNGEWDVPGALEIMYSHLPPRERAWVLCETYLTQGPSAGQIVTREELFEDIFTPLYRYLGERTTAIRQLERPITPHKLATFFLALSLGTLVDLTLPPYSVDADIYAQVGVAGFTLQPLFSHPETGTIQALLLSAAYLNYGGRKYSMEGAWTACSLAAKLAQSMGLHRASSQRTLDPKTTDRRRRLFWELFHMDTAMSLKLGRPPAFRPSYVDCPFPVDQDETLDDNGNILPGYYRIKWMFSRDLLSKVLEVTLSAKPPPYKAILDLDRQIRQNRPTKKFTIANITDTDISHTDFMKVFVLMQHRALVGIYIHRSYFAQAILTHPHDPLCSPYAASYLAAYRCASGLINIKVQYYDKFPQLLMRWWSLWSSFFSAAVIVGTVAIRTPDCHLASRSFAELCLAVELFEKGALHSSRARHGLAILQRLRDKAIGKFSSQDADVVASYSSKPRIDTSDFDDELEIFGGKTRLMVSKMLVRKRASPAEKVHAVETTPNFFEAATQLEDNQRSLVDFFASQMGPDWTPPKPDETLPIPQLPFDYDPSARGGWEQPMVMGLGVGEQNHTLEGEMPMFDFGMDSFMKLLDDYVMGSDVSGMQWASSSSMPGESSGFWNGAEGGFA